MTEFNQGSQGRVLPFEIDFDGGDVDRSGVKEENTNVNVGKDISKVEPENLDPELEIKKQRSNLNVDEKEKPGILCCKYWVLSVLFAALCMGTSLYIYAVNFSSKGIIATAYVAPVPFGAMIIVKFLVIGVDRYRNGVFF